MNIGLKIDWPRGLRFYSISAFTYGGNDYEPKIQGLTSFSQGIGENHAFEVARVTVTLNDQSGEFRDAANDEYDRNFRGKDATLIRTDGTVVRDFYIENAYSTQDGTGANIFVLLLSDKILELDRNVIELISEDFFPAVTEKEHFNKPIPRIYRNNATLSEAIVECRRVERAYLMDFLASSREIDTLNYAIDENGSDITSSCTIENSGGYYYITYTGSDQSIYINAGKTIGGIMTPYEVFQDAIDHYAPNFTGAGFSDSDLDNLLQKRDFRQYYAISEENSSVDVIQHFCDSFGFDWYIDENKELQIVYVDFDNISAAKTFQEAEILDFVLTEPDIDNFHTSAVVNFAYSNIGGDYTQAVKFSSDLAGTYPDKTRIINARYLDDWLTSNTGRATDAYKVWKIYRILNRHPHVPGKITISDEKAKALFPGQLISLEHVNAIASGDRLYQIRKIETDYNNDVSYITVWDYEYLRGIRGADKLLIFSDTENGSDVIYDDAVDGWYRIQNVGPLTWSTNETIFSASTLRFDGSGYLSISRSNSYAIYPADMAAETSFTFDFWAKFDAMGTAEGFIYFSKDGSNYWELAKSAANTVRFKHVAGGSTEINITSTATIDTNWHHYAVCKVSGVIGVYLDGVQILYSGASITSNQAREGVIGSAYGGSYMTGYGTAFHMCHDNFFEAAPVVGLTDTFYPPNAAYTDVSEYGRNHFLLDDYRYLYLDDGEKLILS